MDATQKGKRDGASNTYLLYHECHFAQSDAEMCYVRNLEHASKPETTAKERG